MSRFQVNISSQYLISIQEARKEKQTKQKTSKMKQTIKRSGDAGNRDNGENQKTKFMLGKINQYL